MTVPPAADNTPEKFDAFMREEIVRQGDDRRAVGARTRRRGPARE